MATKPVGADLEVWLAGNAGRGRIAGATLVAGDGKLSCSAVWRTFDFLWSLHIMDYQTRDDFNNWLVIVSAAIGLFLTITGIGILVYRFWPTLKRN